VAVNPALPAKTIPELIRLAKAKPNSLNFGSAGASLRLATEAFNQAAGLKMTHVPYKGSGPAMTDLIAGHIEVLFDAFSSLYPFVQEGKVRALAITSARRSPLAPELPTLTELGLPSVESELVAGHRRARGRGACGQRTPGRRGAQGARQARRAGATRQAGGRAGFLDATGARQVRGRGDEALEGGGAGGRRQARVSDAPRSADMPHLVVEYTGNLHERFDASALLASLNRELDAVGEFVTVDIKSRARRLERFVVGVDGAGRRRSCTSSWPSWPAVAAAEARRRAAPAGRRVREQIAAPPGLRTQMTVRIVDIDPHGYAKAIVRRRRVEAKAARQRRNADADVDTPPAAARSAAAEAAGRFQARCLVDHQLGHALDLFAGARDGLVIEVLAAGTRDQATGDASVVPTVQQRGDVGDPLRCSSRETTYPRCADRRMSASKASHVVSVWGVAGGHGSSPSIARRWSAGIDSSSDLPPPVACSGPFSQLAVVGRDRAELLRHVEHEAFVAHEDHQHDGHVQTLCQLDQQRRRLAAAAGRAGAAQGSGCSNLGDGE
jgi:hypothetical protein